ARYRRNTTKIATKLDTTCATLPSIAKTFVFSPGGLVGTNTSEPGPGVGLLEKNSHFVRVRASPLANRTLPRPPSALAASPPPARSITSARRSSLERREYVPG